MYNVPPVGPRRSRPGWSIVLVLAVTSVVLRGVDSYGTDILGYMLLGITCVTTYFVLKWERDHQPEAPRQMVFPLDHEHDDEHR